MSFAQALSSIGAITVLCALCKVAAKIYLFLRPSRLSKYLHKNQDNYALITGATDGIGLGFARELCRQGCNVILHGRNPQKLQRTQNKLRDEYPNAQVRTFICDAALLNPTEVFDELARELEDVKLTILINNVGGLAGTTEGPYKSYTNFTHDQIDRVINVNVRFTAQITRVLIPLLDRNGPSLILNVSSIAVKGIPYVSLYSATKAFGRTLSTALGMELKMQNRNIDVVALNVAEVQTGGYQVPATLAIPTGKAFARSALRNVGYGTGTVEGYWPHAVQAMFVDMLPERMRQMIIMRSIKSRTTQLGMARHED